MEKKSKRRRVSLSYSVTAFFFIVLVANFQGSSSAASQTPTSNKKKSTQPTVAASFGSSLLLPVAGNVYPLGYLFDYWNAFLVFCFSSLLILVRCGFLCDSFVSL